MFSSCNRLRMQIYGFISKNEQREEIISNFAAENFNSNRYRGQNNKKTLDNIEITNF